MVPAIGRIHYEFIRTEFASSLLSEEKTGEFMEFTFKGQPFGNTSSRYEEVIYIFYDFLKTHFLDDNVETSIYIIG